jgi:23S rRNA pseudouridine1911/1915/1917 synthase
VVFQNRGTTFFYKIRSMQISDWLLYKNNQLIAFNKPTGLPVQPDKTEDKSLLDLAEIYTKSKLEVLHRIDRPASGVVLFAKTDRAVQDISEQFRERNIGKTYLAAVQNRPPQNAGELVHYLVKDGRTNRSKALDELQSDAKKARMHYKVVGEIDNYFLLEIDLQTGRHHQIRAQLAAIGCPIKGDVKYGFRRKNKDRSIHLHAWKIRFDHPVSSEREEVVAALPEEVVWQAFKKDLV